MRIISGFFRGKKIFEPKDNKTRPLKDLVKESIFNIINHSKKMNIKISNSNILDLYSGVGSFGIECLSRGAEKVVFVENYHKVLTILKKNLNDLRTVNNYEILEFDINKNFESKKINDKFDIIFLDPPFKDKNLEELLDNINKKNILKKNGIIIIHRHKKENDSLPDSLKIIDEKIYGISKITFSSFS
tara:strand:- start:467 stop:1030 length:564 start_codon:yes stop_codon:yes gene_type:complete